MPPTSGTASIAGFDPCMEPAKVRAHIGYVPQLLSADGSLTGYENMLLSARLYDIPRSDRHPRIMSALARLGLTDAARQLVGATRADWSVASKSRRTCCVDRKSCFSTSRL